MLKARIDAGEDLDRGIELVSRNLSRLLEAGSRRGSLRIQAYPSMDSMIAGAVVYKAARSLGINAILAASTAPRTGIGPTLLLGFNNLNLKSWDVDDTLLALASGQVKGSPPPGAVYLEVDGSVSSAVGLALAEHKTPTRDLLPLLAASYHTRYVDQAGRFHGVDRALLEALADQASLDMYTGVKSYKPHKWPAWRSLSSTCNPYMHGISGRPGAARDLVSGAGLDPERVLSTLETREVERLASTMLETLARHGRVEAARILGGVIITGDPLIEDLRMAADALAMAAEAGGLGALAGSILDLELEYPIAESLLVSQCRRLVKGIEEDEPVKVKIVPWLRTYKLPKSLSSSPLTAWRALETLGRVEGDSIMVVEDGELRASIVQAEAAQPGVARKLVDNKLARLDGLWLVFNVGGEDV
ncbi:MAG: hypothetical protein F7C08_02860 [Desulfurococcales archaeon]|nr:hypothetical protein [Desulfurococcales archaeon]MCE4605455.1 hypothetical protein [Desulfurococcales archaeon]